MSRTYPVPPADRTIQVIGDTHFGEANWTAPRQQMVLDDLTHPLVPAVPYRLQVGDLTNTATEDAAGLAWFNQMSGTKIKVIGNHDMWSVRTAAQCASVWGLSAKDYTVDMGHALLVVIGPDGIYSGNNVGLYYNPTTLAWLNSTLSAATKPCLIAAHPPLYGTVGVGLPDSGPNAQYKSTNDWFYVYTNNTWTHGVGADSAMRDVIAANHTAVAWLSGHTHSPLSAVDLVKTENIGHNVACVNASALAYCGLTKEWTDQLATLFVTVYDDRIEVRFRDHGQRQWVTAGPENRKVWTVTY